MLPITNIYIYIYINTRLKLKEKKIKYSHNKSTSPAQPRRCQDGHTSLINETHPQKTQNKSYYTYNPPKKQKKKNTLKAQTSSHRSI